MMGNPIFKQGIKWPEQIPSHIQKRLDESSDDYTLADVIAICEEIIALYDNGTETTNTWDGIPVPSLMMSTVTFRNKNKRYV